MTLASAQLALAREYGFASWTKLKVEVERRRILDRRDLEGLAALLADDPGLATTTMEHWCDHPLGASPLSYVEMLRFDTSRLRWRNLAGTGEMATALIAGAQVESVENAAAVGDVTNFLSSATPLDARIRASVMAADHQRLEVIDQLIAAGTPVDSTDATFARHPLRLAAGSGRPASVRRLLAHGADPNLKDAEHGRTALDWCRYNRYSAAEPQPYDDVEAILQSVTRPPD